MSVIKLSRKRRILCEANAAFDENKMCSGLRIIEQLKSIWLRAISRE